MSKINELSIKEAARSLHAREFSVRELWDACLLETKKRNPSLNAFLEVFDDARSEAAVEAAQKRLDTEGERAPLLAGIPLGIKDNLLIEGRRVSAASKILENYIAVENATAIERLEKEGALFLGRTNMDEFAMGSSTEHSAFGPVKNPHDESRVPGGSSGGSSAAVASHMVLGALGSDTGGSIRQPAAHTGVVGLKPTYGKVSRYGLIALGSSLDQVGPLTKTVFDAELLFNALKGKDPKDATSIDDDFYKKPKFSKRLRIGVPHDLLKEGLEEDVRACFNQALERLQKEGHMLVDVSLPTSSYALAVYYVIMPAEASANLARYDGMRYGLSRRGTTLLEDYVKTRTEGFGEETKRRILLGTFVLSAGYIDAYYRKADAARAVLTDEYDQAFQNADVIAFPTTPSPAFPIGGKTDPLSMYLEDIFTVTANLTGMPAISVPMGTVVRDNKKLPVGIHFTAPKGGEELLFTAGAFVTGEAL